MMTVWGWPIVLGVLTGLGLFFGLWGDGMWDWAAWIGLGIPTFACLWFGLRRRR